jgi:hypothetical protein
MIGNIITIAVVESLQAERDALRAELFAAQQLAATFRLDLEELRSQEPVAWILTETIYGLGGETWTESAVGTHKFHIDCEPLYLAAGAKEKQNDRL